ncbi:hypothetical protein GN156_06425 [bacterium LRH843]|nr:hypothetical protein [bacterium LRH843]
MSIIVRKAEEKDLLLIQRLVAKAGLREDGIEHHIDRFLVVKDEDDQLIGTVGLEKYKSDGLLRSLVLTSAVWTPRLSLEFLQLALSYAEEQKIKNLYLCSKGTNSLFHQLGFRNIREDDVPEKVRTSPHFKRNTKGETKVWVCSLGC